jgi:hypothetical protein
MNKQKKIEFKENTEHQFKAILIVYTGADQLKNEIKIN